MSKTTPQRYKPTHSVIFVYLFALTLIPSLVILYGIDKDKTLFAASIFPTTTAILTVCHALIAFFMFMQYLSKKGQPFLVVLAAAYAISFIFLVYKLLIYPDVFTTGGVISSNYNDLGIGWFLRSSSMAIMFIAALLLYKWQKKIKLRARGLFFGIAIITLCILCLGYILSSQYPPMTINIVDKSGNYSQFWQGYWGYFIGLLWVATALLLIHYTRIRNTFWLAIMLSCLSYIGSIAILHTHTNIHSPAWYFTRFYEVTSTIIVIMVLLYDTFQVYKKTLEKYQVSYEKSIRDPMTQLYNRRYYYDTLAQYISRLNRKPTPLAVIVADIDKFKHFNDTYGHVKGDDVIRYVANTMTSSLRSTDICARIGGEEFSALIIGAERKDLHSIVERFRHNVSSKNLSGFADNIPEQVTISVGIYMIESADIPVEQCIARADAAMYQAKRSGRNRVVMYQSEILQKTPQNVITRSA